MNKKQIWLRPDQSELVVECLRFVRKKLNESGTVLNDAHPLAARFTVKRLDEIIPLFETAP